MSRLEVFNAYMEFRAEPEHVDELLRIVTEYTLKDYEENENE